MSVTGFKFEEFELYPHRCELRRSGRPVKLENIPLNLLTLLVEKKGGLVSRQVIIDHLWGKDVFVDTEHGINTAIRKIRQVLKDNPDDPRFVQTVTGKGYRFIAEVNDVRPELKPSPPYIPEAPPPSQPIWGQPPSPALSEVEGAIQSTAARQRASSKVRLAGALVILLLVTTVLLFALRNRIFASNRAAQIHSIAVIPLANLSGDKSQDYFADGMTDELITALAKNHNLRVVSRSSAMQYKSVNRPVRDIARELGVDGILEGSIERTPNKVHLTVQLIYAPTDSHVWAESYDRDRNQAYSLPEELSQTVAREVRIATSAAAPQRYINPEAHDAYLQGLEFWYGNNADEGLPYFEKAIQLQPDYAAAWSGLSATYAWLSVSGQDPSSDVTEQWESTARKAIELDDSLAQAHNSMAAWYLFYARDWQRAEAESLRSLALDPLFAEGYHMHSYILTVTNRLEEALEEQKRGTSIDPFARPWALGYTYYHARQFENAVKEFRLRIAARQFDLVCHHLLAESNHFLGRDNEAFEQLKETLALFGQEDSIPILQQAFDRGGFAAVAAWQVDNQPDVWGNIDNRKRKRADRTLPKKYFSPFWYALNTGLAGRKEQTLHLLDEAYLVHDPRIIFLQNEPTLDFLHHEPRYQALVKKLGLPPAW